MRTSVAALVLLAGLCGHGKADGQTPAAAEPRTQPLAAIDVRGVSVDLARLARSAIVLSIGHPYDLGDARESLQNLYALGQFGDARVHLETTTAGPALVFHLVAQRRIDRVRVAGASPWSSARMRAALSIRHGDPIDEARAEREAAQLQEALADDGYLLASVTASLRTDRPSGQTDLELEVDAGTATRLGAVRILGDSPAPSIVLRTLLGLEPGTTYRPSRLEAGLADLRQALVEAHHFFARLRVVQQTLDLSANTMEIAVEVAAGPRVDLDFSGLDRSEAELHGMLAIFEFRTVEDWALKDSRQALVRALQDEGYWRPLVTYARTRDEQGRNTKVSFRILTGRKARLQRIEFVNNEPVAASELLAAIRSRPSAFLSPGRFISEWWERDTEALLTVFRRRGFRDVQLQAAEVNYAREADGVVARVAFVPGPRTFLSAVTLTLTGGDAAPGIDLVALRGRLEQRPLMPLDPALFRQDSNRLRALLANAGYARSVIDARLVADPDDPHQLEAQYAITPGPRAHVERVLIAGNRKTATDVIRRELPLQAGSPLSFGALLDAQSRLYRLGLFDRVDIEPARPDDVTEQRALVVRVLESPPIFVNYGAGIDTEEGVRGTVAVGHGNVGGRDREVSLSTRASVREQRLRLLFTEPYFLGRRQEATASAFYSNERRSSFDIQRFGASLQLLWSHSDEAASIARYTFRDISTFNIDIDPTLLRREDQSTRVGALGFVLAIDRRSDPVEPTDGGYHTIDLEAAARPLGSETDFMTAFARSFWYRTLGSRVTVAGGLRAGIKLPYASSQTIPLPERFFGGGSTTLRGFALDRAGPVDSSGNALGGEVLLLANLEVRMRIRGAVGGVVFVDVGNVYATPSTVTWSNTREAVGVGLRYQTAVGPIRLDLARLMDRQPGEDRLQLFFSVGHTF